MSDSFRVPFLDIGATYTALRGELDAAIARVMRSGWFLLGEELAAFEAEYAAYVGARHAVGVGSGLDALVLGLRALGVGAGDEVIVPSNTYIATWLAVSAVGATPIPVEPDPDTHNINAASVASAITKQTAAVLPVHLYGMPVEMRELLALAANADLRVLCDAAQAHGARLADGPIGSFGDVVAWSFYPSKNLGAFGDGGAVTTNDDAIAATVRLLRNYGSERKYENQQKGVNSRLDEVQAAILRVKLCHLDRWNQRRREIAGRYREKLGGSALILQDELLGVSSAWHVFVVRSAKRDALQRHLAERGIQTLIHYPIPPHRQAAYADVAPLLPELPIAEQLASEVLSLPIGPHMTDEQIDAVIDAVVDFGASAAPV